MEKEKRRLKKNNIKIGKTVKVITKNPWGITKGIVVGNTSNYGWSEYDYYLKTDKHGIVGFQARNLQILNK